MVGPGAIGGASRARAVNNRGQVVGEAETVEPRPGEEAETRAFLWESGRMRDLGTLPQSDSDVRQSKAFAINNLGQVVGGSGGYEVMEHEMGGLLSASPFLYSRGKMTLLFKPIRGAVELGEAFGINDRGQVVGVNGGGAFLWQKGRITYLGTLQKGGAENHDAGNRALAINDRGQVVGIAVIDAAGLSAHPFLWQRGRGMRDLGTPSGTTSGSANAISDRGDVVGVAYGQARGEVAWQWRQGRMQALPGLPGTQESNAEAINSRGLIVGQSGRRATVWKHGKPYDLNGLIGQQEGWLLEDATGTNERGQIVGFGKHDGKERGFLLTPVAASGSK